MLLLALAACGWNLPQRHDYSLPAPLWTPESALATNDGVYLLLPHAGAIVRVPVEGEATLVDIGEGVATKLVAVPDSDAFVALVERYRCDDEKGKARTLVDCPLDERVVTTDLLRIEDAEVLTTLAVPGSFNRLSIAPDARMAIASLDLDDPSLKLTGVVDLTGVVVVDLVEERSETVNIGFAPETVRFQVDENGRTTGALVLAQGQVAQLDLSTSPVEVAVTYNLALDPDVVVVPTSVELTPDGQYGLITVRGQADLYVLDLQAHTINLVELAGVPADLRVSPTLDRSVLVYGDAPVVEVLDHQRFELESWALDEPMDRVVEDEGRFLLSSTKGRRDAYHLDLTEDTLLEFRLENRPISTYLAPGGAFAIAFTEPSGGASLVDRSPGMELLDFSSGDTRPYLLEGTGVGVAFSEVDGRLDALILQTGVPYVYQLTPSTGEASQTELDRAPLTIGAFPGGGFFATQQSATGALSFLDPSTGAVTSQYGFATLGALDPIELVEEP